MALQWGGIAILGLLLGLGCSSSDAQTSVEARPPAANGASAADAGAGGATPNDGGPHAADDDAGAGGACAGDYACPSVEYSWYASITVDLPLSVADAARATFSACRNGTCYSAKGDAQSDPQPGSSWVEDDSTFVSVFLTFDDSGLTPSAVMKWQFQPDSNVASGDHYSLTVQPVGAAEPTTLFDQQVTYTTEVSDPTLVSEGYCRHCSEIQAAHVDTRASK